MSSARIRRTLAASVLWTGCTAGVICLVWTLGILLAGVTPLVFLSGSMSPAINTGDLAFARTVPAATLGVGDVVSVPDSRGVRVTHRVVEADPAGGAAYRLRLRGDANATVDAEPYTVTEADQVVARVPGLGHLLNVVRTPGALLAGGALVAGAMTVGFSRRPDDDLPASESAELTGPDGLTGQDGPASAGRIGRGGAITAAVVVLAGLTLAQLPGPGTVSTLAAWSDRATMTTGRFQAHQLAPPAELNCQTALLGRQVQIWWEHVDTRYDYLVVKSTSGQTSSQVVTGSGDRGSTQQVVFTEGGSSTVTIRSRLKSNSQWVSSGSVSQDYSRGLLNYICG